MNEEGKKLERFTCLFCAYFWDTDKYENPVEYDRRFVKISTKCPRCGIYQDKLISKKDLIGD